MATNRDGYMKEYRKAKSEGKATVALCHCGKALKGRLSKVRGICSICWKETPEGKAKSKAAVKKHRNKLKEQG